MEAAERIDQLRKADVEIIVVNANGNSFPSGEIMVEQLTHDYAFSSAVVSCRFAENNCQDDLYESKIADLDGNGHRFSEVVFENALKWPSWENSWITSKDETVDAAVWLRENDIRIRGHRLKFNNGTYFYKFIADGETVGTKKMIVVK